MAATLIGTGGAQFTLTDADVERLIRATPVVLRRRGTEAQVRYALRETAGGPITGEVIAPVHSEAARIIRWECSAEARRRRDAEARLERMGGWID